MANRQIAFRSHVVGAVALAVLPLLVAAAPVAAYKQFIPPANYQNCQNTDSSPCVEWPKTAQNLSIIVDVYLSSTLGGANIDLRPDILAVFPKYNDIAARNPYLQQTTSTTNEEVWVARTSILDDPTIFGVTYVRPACTDYQEPPVDFGCAAPEYHIFASKIYFNSYNVTWNHTYSFGCNQFLTACWADSRVIATHEFGHMEGLAHVNPDESFASIMKAPIGYHGWYPTTWWTNVDDHNGIIAIYGAYP